MVTRKIYFNEAKHKYTDELGNEYVSATTLIGKYEEKFDVDYWARYKSKEGKGIYKNQTPSQIKKMWERGTKVACDIGNEKHNYIDERIKISNGYSKNFRFKNKDRLYTIDLVLDNPNLGVISLDELIKLGLKDRFPIIFNRIKELVERGFRVFSEIGVYNYDFLISGMIDLLLLNEHGEFYILDWKTNKAPIRFESGYFKKDKFGALTDNYVLLDKTFLPPIAHIAKSKGNTYGLQLSLYSHLLEEFGLKRIDAELYHITHDFGENKLNIINVVNTPYFKKEVATLMEHNMNGRTLNNQLIFNI